MESTIEHYRQSFNALADSLRSSEPSWLNELRGTALEHFENIGLPHKKHEDWLYTDLSPIADIPFSIRTSADETEIAEALEACQIKGFDAHLLVFVNGLYDGELSSHNSLPAGVTLESMSTALEKHGDFLKDHLDSELKGIEYPFQALNTAMMTDGLFLRIGTGIQVDRPIHTVYITTRQDSPSAMYPRNLIVLDENASATIVESFAGPEGAEYFTNSASELLLGKTARLEQYRVFRDSNSAYHFTSTAVRQKDSSELHSISVILGGRLVRNDIFVELEGDNCISTANGLYCLQGDQQVDNFTRFRHIGLNGNSRQIFKGILDDKSRGVFDGRIFVNEGAQKTDAVQTNRNLLLTDDAVAYAKPQLEIYADDVKCTHGATTGQIDEDQLFYLQSRGFERNQARAMLTYAFAGELIEEIAFEPLRNQLSEELAALMA